MIASPSFRFFFQIIVLLKKRYEKLNDAAYSALKYRDCAANIIFNEDGLPVPCSITTLYGTGDWQGFGDGNSYI